MKQKELVLDRRRRCSFAKIGRKQDTRYLAESFENGTIVLHPATTISVEELDRLNLTLAGRPPLTAHAR